MAVGASAQLLAMSFESRLAMRRRWTASERSASWMWIVMFGAAWAALALREQRRGANGRSLGCLSPCLGGLTRCLFGRS